MNATLAKSHIFHFVKIHINIIMYRIFLTIILIIFAVENYAHATERNMSIFEYMEKIFIPALRPDYSTSTDIVIFNIANHIFEVPRNYLDYYAQDGKQEQCAFSGKLFVRESSDGRITLHPYTLIENKKARIDFINDMISFIVRWDGQKHLEFVNKIASRMGVDIHTFIEDAQGVIAASNTRVSASLVLNNSRYVVNDTFYVFYSYNNEITIISCQNEDRAINRITQLCHYDVVYGNIFRRVTFSREKIDKAAEIEQQIGKIMGDFYKGTDKKKTNYDIEEFKKTCYKN